MKKYNEEVPMHINEVWRIMKMIQCKKNNWTGYILRHESILHIIEGKMMG